MSLMARYYDFVFGGLIGHPKLTALQWRTLLVRCRIPTLTTLWVALGLGAGGFTIAFTLRALSHPHLIRDTPLSAGCLWGLLVSAPVLCEYVIGTVHARLLSKRYLRSAASELGYVRVCVECGYDCRSLAKDSVQCPECGAVVARPSTRVGE